MTPASSTVPSSRYYSEQRALERLLGTARIDEALRERITDRAVWLVRHIREDSDPGMMELFLGEYGLSTDEGVALMCLAEALLRVPDDDTMDALIEDKIAPSEWGLHLGRSHSSLVNASTWALFMTRKVLKRERGNSIGDVLHGAIKRLGEPLIREAVSGVMKVMGRQFVLGETIRSAMSRAERAQAQGFTHSYDMLGEAARTEDDAKRYLLSYSNAIGQLGAASRAEDISRNPGISVKLSALHPRYEPLKRERVMDELVPRALSLAILAKSAGIGLNIDAEEAGRLDLSLELIEAVLSDPGLKGWRGFGVVVQAYNRHAPKVLDWLYALATRLDRHVMVRLVKGAYWDSEIKLAQVEGHRDFPVFTRKEATDVSYICCAQKLLGMVDRIYPQFATHNAHTVAAILELSTDKSVFEFQRLHGMGEALHDTVLRRQGTRCRIYAPVGAHKDLLAYLVRRLLENGANSSFVNQIVDESTPPEEVAADPFAKVERVIAQAHNPRIRAPADLFAPERVNSQGWDLENLDTLETLRKELARFDAKQWVVKGGSGESVTIRNPASAVVVGTVQFANRDDVTAACVTIQPWATVSATERAAVLCRAADLYEQNSFELFALLMREAGKVLLDCVGEVREAVDFLRYYASEASRHSAAPAGVFTCISPWNFPLAIFTGQVAAALAAGNGVLAKPAETTSLIAGVAVSLLREAGVPDDVLHLLPGTGAEVGNALTSNPRVDGVCFTGSTQTAQRINRTMAEHLSPQAALIAETGGLNAMVVDSTALPEQVVADIVASAFQSAGQRCSALRILYVQDDIAAGLLRMLYGAMDELQLGDPWDFTTDIGPVIDRAAQQKINDHIAQGAREGRVLKQLTMNGVAQLESGAFVAPTVMSVDGIGELHEEIFGPVLHVATFAAGELDQVIAAINDKGFGLTFGLHSRIDDRVQYVVDNVHAGNLYINRNQIGAVVGSQPFGGLGLSGTGPKAGGPRYLPRFLISPPVAHERQEARAISFEEIDNAFSRQSAPNLAPIETLDMPGPTGESNRCSLYPRAHVLCLGPSAQDARDQALTARRLGCQVVAAAPGLSHSDGLDGVVVAQDLARVRRLDAVVFWSADVTDVRRALASREGSITPLLTGQDFEQWLVVERHVCIDTTAAGGNAALMDG
ncbi:MAG: RHH-type proline utilization regulon transcriptional repressor/proline dehydrogenase [Gammaproteobacteria bacterium]|jgi:RHH-type proline utilization regulon transcriptional repressor/proline dehydrogenase/delta 1-pyrroline-5-carboxylate dehydrogenase